ncbi:succinoglycan biosynthesis protein exoh [Massilia varians]|uniref:Succinoglycan biosynthesis protein exoh n=1 Tax=Massilia varians TaxID=457921 RepID=A0ABN6TF37_9BURK|nr:acyltransferase [Massilia varians]BDT60842.1 succinoglycan biosynthesis protein exoh [Massilia varians]
MATQKIVFERIALLRYLMIVGIVVLHTPPYVPVSEIGSGAFDFVKALFQNAAFRATVPVLTLISGYLLFRSGLDRHWGQLMKKKTRTILVPFLAFNLIVLAGAFGAQHYFGLSMAYQLVPFDLSTWMNAAFSIERSPINYPLHFLRDLFVLMALSPLFGFVLRSTRPWIGLVAITIISMNNLDGILVLRTTMPIMFYLGGMAATRQWNLLALDRYALPCLGLFLALCVCLVYFQIANTLYFRYLAPFLIWPAASLLQHTEMGRWLQSQSKTSFFIFLAHAPLLLMVSMAFDKLGSNIPYPLKWITIPVVTVTILALLYHALMRLCPRLFSPLIGGKPPERETPPVSVPARISY